MRKAHERANTARFRELRQRLRRLPSTDPHDPAYRRLRYVRYADDTLFGLAGPKAEAEEIKARLAQFLREDLKLELATEKTLVTHARTSAARFLGYEITVQHSATKITRRRPSVNGVIRLRVPMDVVRAKCSRYLKRGKPAHRSDLMNASDHEIISVYGAEYRGIVQYYLLATDVFRLARLRWVMETSLLKTLAGKHRSRVTKMAKKHKATIETPFGPRKCLQVVTERPGRQPLVARFGGIPLRRKENAVITDVSATRGVARPKELVTRLLAGRCELCRDTDGITVHHIRKLADLTARRQPHPTWMGAMLKKRRKSLVVCRACHADIHMTMTAEHG